ncbi:preprotein translocase subunit SecG [Candidatus Giovannonibacteria bacterium RIFCSPLOWO2_02_FULL_45_14]|uniref:Protein-export membrane protein SecG n=1 Tax=Candidatus Giovannonibacteria bacterium RIFCSPLOWO2_12_FULL_44_15 TaxID=1798364 RepID=A0A1F5XZP0_9BACT|nr:MAG: preprotein translocase subunit SecG [Candidatus Giovannonibacteria bacterium RIFCSPHIGHO2_02_FULL_44_31]OGF75935.1 MAG: preprotein translocase subunit SecG [Candidatus Giovannonibacteria bacterium RIFCSPHIGHO2_12_FULL_44_29]OGF90654.1 MAG: preprotein translocase subunit SecG [Candidatus Giovannonibacteria bacterium RIFCSPLOWO2_02_FULL_45_14]OGF93394.1 MAG: preprotein translocase subunit SecG [Candidatus Giovannonibacteria bacterium RIFCSPLOWO2_12_FULL_44_15]
MSFLGSAMPYLLIGTAILLVTAILFQQKGSGLSSAFGGEGNIYTTKRGLEKILFRITIVLGILFLALSLLNLLLQK